MKGFFYLRLLRGLRGRITIFIYNFSVCSVVKVFFGVDVVGADYG